MSKFKILFVVALLVALLEAGWIYYSRDLSNVVNLPNLFVNIDQDSGYFSATGSWITTDTVLATPLQTTSIECFKEQMFCYISTAEIFMDNNLTHFTEIVDIEEWTEKDIRTLPKETAAGCVEYYYNVDIQTETISSTRSTLNTEGICSGTGKDKIRMTLSDGYMRLKNR